MATYEATVTALWVTFEAVWHTAMDERTCPKCMKLEGQTWTFPKLEGPLVDPRFGPVYDLTLDQPLTHPNCRCYLEIRPIVELEKTELFQVLKSTLGEYGYMPSNINEATEQVNSLKANIVDANTEARRWEMALGRTLGMLALASGTKDVREAYRRFQRLIMIIRLAQNTARLFMLASGPYGWAMFTLSALGTGMAASDFATDVRSYG